MSVLVTDRGFAPPEAQGHEVSADCRDLAPLLTEPALRVVFAAQSDGRGFTLARRLRAAGYAGRLIAVGPLISDQYPLARRCGFDGVEIPDALAARQPAEHWRAPDGRDYQSRLGRQI